jgi:ADP-heptose:LPS heptosyltransferase
MRILALVPGGIGDQILFFPTLEDLKRQYPNAAIDVMVEPRSKSAYRVCQWVHEVLLFDYKDRNSLADYLNLLGIIRDREYDIAITLGQRWAVGMLLWLNGIPVRVGYKTKTSCFISHQVPLKTEQYAAYMYHDLLGGLDLATPCPKMKLTLPKEDITWAESEQQRLGIEDSGYVLIHGGSSRLALSKGIDKIYPVSQWQVVIEDLQKKQPELPIVLLLGPEDQQWVAQMREVCPNIKVTSPSDVGKLASMIAGANLMLCTDSAPMHLAVAVETYTIALFGPTDPAKLLPPDHGQCVGVKSPTGAIADIKPQDILEQIWRG